jgi:hypothetical protein
MILSEYERFIEAMIFRSFINKPSAKCIGIVICHDYKHIVENYLSTFNMSVQCNLISKLRSHFERGSNSTTSNEYLITASKTTLLQ